MQKYKKPILAVIGVSAVLGLIAFGFDTKSQVTSHCSSESSIKVIAEFSETSIAIDFDGMPYTDTDYWSEQVSETYFVRMKNLSVIDSNWEYTKLASMVAIPASNVPFDKSVRNSKHFDRYKTVSNTVNKQVFSNGEYITINNSAYLGCFNLIDKTIPVKYWYGISYGVVNG